MKRRVKEQILTDQHLVSLLLDGLNESEQKSLRISRNQKYTPGS
jgi:hypothetical protein